MPKGFFGPRFFGAPQFPFFDDEPHRQERENCESQNERTPRCHFHNPRYLQSYLRNRAGLGASTSGAAPGRAERQFGLCGLACTFAIAHYTPAEAPGTLAISPHNALATSTQISCAVRAGSTPGSPCIPDATPLSSPWQQPDTGAAPRGAHTPDPRDRWRTACILLRGL